MHRDRHPRASVAVWVVEPHGWDTTALVRHLDPGEAERASSLPADAAARFVLARALLRGVLGEHLRCAPREVDLRVVCTTCSGPHGRVEVAPAPGGARLHVSLTRSGPLVAVALCTTGPVGVDVESPEAVAGAPLADVALAPAELARRAGAAGSRAPSLAHTWVRKEAALKALGTGLLVDPADLDLGRAGRPRGGLTHHHGTALAIGPLALRPGAVGAVAVAATDPAPPWASRRTGRRAIDVRLHDGARVLARLAMG